MLRSSPCVDVSVLGKDTNSQNERSNGESRHNIPRPQLLCFLLPLLKLYLSNEMDLFLGKTLFRRVYPGGKGSAGLLRRLVGHACRQWGTNSCAAARTVFQKIYRAGVAVSSPSVCCQIGAEWAVRAPPSCTRMKQNCATFKWAPIAIKVPTRRRSRLSWGEIRGNSAIFRKIRRNCGVYLGFL